MEQKKVGKTAGGPKRPAPAATEEPRKKVAIPQKPVAGKTKPLITTASASGNGALGVSKPKLPLPIPSKPQVKNPILVNLQKPTTLVDSNGDIMGLNEYIIT